MGVGKELEDVLLQRLQALVAEQPAVEGRAVQVLYLMGSFVGWRVGVVIYFFVGDAWVCVRATIPTPFLLSSKCSNYGEKKLKIP